MATSNSTKCFATAFVFSGRPDPSWEMKDELVARLEAIWTKSLPGAGAQADAPALGYRGCRVDCGKRGVWTAYRGVVTRGNERRADAGREFETTVLESAPRGMIPGEVLREVSGG